MADKGIIFSAPMVRALLEGRKTQTRRLIKPQPPERVTSAGNYSNSREGATNQWSWLSGDPRDIDTWEFEGDFRVPYTLGDRLYVRENWRVSSDCCEGWHPDNPIGWIDYQAGGSFECRAPSLDAAERAAFLKGEDRDWDCLPQRWRPCIHLPRWASRLTLTVTDVRVQRVAEISASDCYAEGIERPIGPMLGSEVCARDNARNAFRALWNSLHDKPGERWEDNPWIVAVSFDVEHGNIDRIGP